MGWAERCAALGRLQATTVALRLGRALGLGGGSEQQAWRPPAPVAEVAAGRRAQLPAAQRERYDALIASAGPGSDAASVLERALAGGAGLDALDALADLWPGLSERDRAQVGSPLRPGPGADAVLLGTDRASQTDQTTCGSTVLAMLAAAGDPLLALWLVTGRTLPADVPVEVRALSATDRAAATPGARFAALQLATKTASNRGALGPLPWPARLGTPPWGAAHVARHPGAAFRAVMIDDTDPAGLGALLDRADRALAAGVPIPLFTGGDLASGPTTAVPRHVVLLTPGPGARYAIFEPASGAVHQLARAELLAPAGPRAALGGWMHVCWAVLPESVG